MDKSNLENLIDLIEALGYRAPYVQSYKTNRGYSIECSCDDNKYPHAEGETIEEAAAKRIEAFRLRASNTRSEYSRSIEIIDRILPEK